ncbi:MAG: hypothetical protein V4671_06780, partial [Armatimonadota bacterium]
MSNTVKFAVEDLSDSQLRELIGAAVVEAFGKYSYLNDINRAKGTVVFNRYDVDADGYRNWESCKLNQATFSVGDGYAVTFGEPTAVIAVTDYEPVTPTETAAFSVESSSTGDATARFAVSSDSRRVEGDFAVYPNSLLFRAGEYVDKNFSMSAQELAAAASSWTPISGNVQHTDFLKGRAAFIEKAWTEENDTVLRGEVKVPLSLDTLITDAEKGISMEWTRAGKFADGFALCTNPRVSDAALMALDAQAKDSEPMATPAPKPGFLERLKAFFTENGVKIEDIEATTTEPVVPAADPAVDAEKEQLRQDAIAAQAELFATQELTANRITPAEKDALVADFVRAAEDDAATPTTVTFSVGTETKTGGRVDALRSRQSLRPAHKLTQE